MPAAASSSQRLLARQILLVFGRRSGGTGILFLFSGAGARTIIEAILSREDCFGKGRSGLADAAEYHLRLAGLESALHLLPLLIRARREDWLRMRLLGLGEF